MEERSPDINSDDEDFEPLEGSVRTTESSRSIDIDQIGNFEVNPPEPEDHSPSEDDDFENFVVEFGSRPQDLNNRSVSPSLDPSNPPSEIFEVEDSLSFSVNPNVHDERPSEQFPRRSEVEGDLDLSPDREPEREEDVEVDLEVDVREKVVELDSNEQSGRDTDFQSGSSENVTEREVVHEDLSLDLGGSVSSKHIEPTTSSGQLELTAERDPELKMDSKRDGSTSRSTSRKRGRPRNLKVVPDKPSDPDSSRLNVTATSESKPRKDKSVRIYDKNTQGEPPKTKKVMTPAVIISEYRKGRLTNEEAYDALIRFRVNSLLPKGSDKMYYDKDGDVRLPKGYNFGKSRDPSGKTLKKHGLTRIEREILAYQKSTHMLIPRSIFARIVREIAQGWFRGEGQIKFTVEALSALQVATEDEITKLLEISTACSHHAKRITLRVDDMRLARFCRGRQEYEFSNMNV